jgi:hypothetical protein
MRRTLVLGGSLGGVALFVWGMISYMLLPWHTATLEKFTDETAVSQALSAHAAGSGMYLLPNPHRYDPGLSDAQRKAAQEDGMTRMMQGPFMFAAVGLRGTRDTGAALALNLLANILSASLVTWLLLQTTGLHYWGRVGFVVAIALTTCVIAYAPYWIWWSFSSSFTAVEFADHLTGWALTGMVISRFVPAHS